jgi:hypothetical protein
MFGKPALEGPRDQEVTMNDAPNPTPDDDVDRTEDVAALKAEAKKRRLALRAAAGVLVELAD